MKKILAAMAVAALLAVASIVVAPPASAYTYKENKVWSWVRSQSPLASEVIGKAQTIRMARLTCRVLNEGFDIYDVVDAITGDTYDMDPDVEEAYLEFAGATTVAGIRYLCPRHQWQLDSL